jgi:hypothetical protein
VGVISIFGLAPEVGPLLRRFSNRSTPRERQSSSPSSLPTVCRSAVSCRAADRVPNRCLGRSGPNRAPVALVDVVSHRSAAILHRRSVSSTAPLCTCGKQTYGGENRETGRAQSNSDIESGRATRRNGRERGDPAGTGRLGGRLLQTLVPTLNLSPTRGRRNLHRMTAPILCPGHAGRTAAHLSGATVRGTVATGVVHWRGNRGKVLPFPNWWNSGIAGIGLCFGTLQIGGFPPMADLSSAILRSRKYHSHGVAPIPNRTNAAGVGQVFEAATALWAFKISA